MRNNKRNSKSYQPVAGEAGDFYGCLRELINEMRAMRASSQGKQLRQVGIRTAHARSVELFRMFHELRNVVGMKIETPHGLKAKHIEALVSHWQSKSLSITTIDNRLSFLRVFCEVALGKAGLVLSLSDYIPGAQRVRICREDKSVSAKVDPQEMINRALASEEWVDVMLRLLFAFGLRVNEGLQFKPIDGDRGVKIAVLEGCKGGRPREITISRPGQREALDAAKALAAKNPKGYIAPPRKTLQAVRNRFYYVCRRIGLTKKILGATAHGLRHDFLQTEFEIITGVPAPVKATGDGSKEKRPSLRDVPPDLIARAQFEIANKAGHNRKASAGAYIGSVSKALRDEARSQPAPTAAALPEALVFPRRRLQPIEAELSLFEIALETLKEAGDKVWNFLAVGGDSIKAVALRWQEWIVAEAVKRKASCFSRFGKGGNRAQSRHSNTNFGGMAIRSDSLANIPANPPAEDPDWY